MYKSDASQSLPLFQIISPRTTNTMQAINEEKEVHQKPKRKNKKPEVQVHKSQKDNDLKDDIKIHKTFSANFNSHKTKHRHKNNEEDSDKEEKVEENDGTQRTKIKRKHLMKENERLTMDNIKLNDQLSSYQQIMAKKDTQVTKLKEKLTSIQNFNKEILNENQIIKTQYEDILVEIEKFKTEKSKCVNCEELKTILKKNITDFESVQKENKELNEDLNMLKNVVYRLNVQLERYQDKLRKNNITVNSPNIVIRSNESPCEQNQTLHLIQAENTPQHNDHYHTPISWGNTNVHTLGPLLDAYQDTVKEKEDIIHKYELELSHFTGKLKSIIDENELLHKKNLDDTELLRKTIDDFENMRIELKNTKEQNEVLIKKCALKHDKAQELCRIYDHKIISMRRDYEILQEQYHKTRAELSCVHSKYQALVDSNDTLKNDRQSQIPLSVHTASVNECKRLFEELKLQYESEKIKLLNQIKQMEQQIPNMETQIVNLTTEKQELHIKSKTSEKQLKKLEQKLAEVQSSLTHTQIARESCKRQLSKAIEFGKELVKEQESLLHQLSSRSKESKAAVRYGNSIVNKMDSLKMQLKTVQKDAFEELATVEQRINDQDWSIESMRRDHQKEIASLVQELHEKDTYIAKLVDQNAPAQPYLLFRDRHVQFS